MLFFNKRGRIEFTNTKYVQYAFVIWDLRFICQWFFYLWMVCCIQIIFFSLFQFFSVLFSAALFWNHKTHIKQNYPCSAGKCSYWRLNFCALWECTSMQHCKGRHFSGTPVNQLRRQMRTRFFSTWSYTQPWVSAVGRKNRQVLNWHSFLKP